MPGPVSGHPILAALGLVAVALGLTLIYGVLNQINFAHADFVTVGAFTAFLTATRFATKWLGMPDTAAYLVSL